VERELVMSGIGGQGVQLASSALAAAAFADGLEVQLFGSYGGMMRGGATESAVVFGTGPLEAPPTVSTAWSVILMHDEYADHARSCLVAGSLLLVNTSIVHAVATTPGTTVLEVPATTIATEVGHPMAASLVMAGAYAAATGIVSTTSLTGAVDEALPPYRAQHRALNASAVAAGAAAVEPGAVPAWPEGAR
jgi:Pyruvate/2-oxoacid:ferredoxin oxidoreductase gamma subunit